MFPWGRAAIMVEAIFLGMVLAADIGAGLPLSITVSELVYGPTSALAVSSFAVHGLSLLCLGMALEKGPRAAAFIATAGMVLVTVFWTDVPGETTLDGRLHLLGAVMAFGGVAAAAWMRRLEQPLVWLSLLVVANTLLVAGLAYDGGLPLGITERMQMYLNGAWIFMAAGWTR